MIHEIKDISIKAAPAFLSGIALVYFGVWLEKKPRVIAYFTSIGVFNIKNNDTNSETKVSTHVLVVRNQGGKPAKNVTINHICFDGEICVLPSFDYKLENISQGGKAIVLPNLPPKEEVMITYLYSNQNSNQNPVKHGPIFHEEGKAEIVRAIAIPEISPLIYYGSIFFIYIGMFTCIVLLLFSVLKFF